MRSHPLALAALFVLFASSAALAGCGSDETTDGTGASGTGAAGTSSSSGTGGAGPSSGTGNTGGEPPTCDVESVEGEGPMLTPGLISATILDVGGDPVSGSEVQLCGINKCLYGETDSTGFASVDGAGQPLDRPAFKFGDGLTHARFAVLLDESSADLGELVTAELPGSGAEMTAGGEATSGPVTLAFADDAIIEVDELIYDEPNEQTFRAVSVPAAQVVPEINMPAGIELVYGVGPLVTKFCPRAQVTVANDAGWEAGAAVEFWAHGVDVFEYAVSYGGWAKVSDGVVSEDGTTVSTTEGFELLTTFGVKLK